GALAMLGRRPAPFCQVPQAAGGSWDQDGRDPAEIEANLDRVYHLDEPLLRQYGRYLLSIVQGDFGPSFQYKDFTVTELIRGGFPVSLRLGGLAIVVAFLIGTTLGCYAALRQNSAADAAVMAAAMSGVTIPNFVMAP